MEYQKFPLDVRGKKFIKFIVSECEKEISHILIPEKRFRLGKVYALMPKSGPSSFFITRHWDYHNQSDGKWRFYPIAYVGENFEKLPLFQDSQTQKNIISENLYFFQTGGKIEPLPKTSRFDKAGKDMKGFWEELSKNPNEWLTQEIKKCLAKDKDAICVMRSFFSITNELDRDEFVKRMRKANNYFFFYGKRLVYSLPANTTIAKIKKAIIETASTDHYYGFVLRKGKNDIIKRNKDTLTKKDLQLFAKNLEMIFVGAYDGESYIIWDFSERNDVQ
ncbi:hypothetical protein HZA38_02560 [Candidatus Peregrinibacteria bacterium]|nr:hypothetical protein [Candidatus Peregrinibacteria bacterium]